MIHADENVRQPVAEGLRRRGWEVTTVLEADTLGYSDFERLTYAAERGRIPLTFDDDSLSLAESDEGAPTHAGIVFISRHGKDVGEIVRRVDTTSERRENENPTDEILYA